MNSAKQFLLVHSARHLVSSMSTSLTDTHHFQGFSDPRTGLGPGDIVIVGAGLAGLFTALKLAPLPVTIISPTPLGDGTASQWAQGGIAAAVEEGDTPEAHARDTVTVGGGLVDEAVADLVTRAAPARVRDLLTYGIPFDRDLAGHFILSREAAHSAKRIVRVSGDRAGAAIMQALVTAVRATPRIRILEGYQAADLVQADDRIVGVKVNTIGTPHTQPFDFLPASAVVLATGGIGSLYSVSTNPTLARGEALAFAARTGAVIADAEFVQFHPTALDVGVSPAPLATEALRGEGAILVNDLGTRFMTPLHQDAELAPRDIVARGVGDQVAQGRKVFLDCRTAVGAKMASSFPTVTAHCRAAGIDPAHDLIPVTPAAHYHMGGIATGVDGRTTVTGLWAIGEVASTGLHGANRLASNSLLEALVFGHRAAEDITQLVDASAATPQAVLKPVGPSRQADVEVRSTALARLKRTMTTHVGVVRDGVGLFEAFKTLENIQAEAGADPTLANTALTARFITGAALMRQESRGAHARRDFPDTDATCASRSFLTLNDIETLTDDLMDRGQRRVSGVRSSA